MEESLLKYPKKNRNTSKTRRGWTPDVIVGRDEFSISCSVRTLYRRFKNGEFDQNKLPMQGKRKPNGHLERRGKQAFKRNIAERETDHSSFETEFGHLGGDTMVGVHHKSVVITLVERFSKVIIALKPKGRKVIDIEKATNTGFQSSPKNLFKSIAFDCGKEFSNWKNISNATDIDIYFADLGTPSQRGLNEHQTFSLEKMVYLKNRFQLSQSKLYLISCSKKKSYS